MIHATSPAERVRRYDALRSTAGEQGLDALIISSRGDEFMRGRVQYLSDIFQWAGWGFLLLPLRGEATFVGDPLWGLEAADDGDKGWVADRRATQEPGRELASVLIDLGLVRGRIGIVGLADITTAAHLRELAEAIPGATLTDATVLFEDVRAIKSPEEMANLEDTSDILRRVFTALENEIRPGAMIRDVLAEAHRLCRRHGCVEGIALLGRPPSPGFSPDSTERLGRDDIIVLDLEWGGPTGYWLEVRRCFSFGPPPDRVRRFHEIRSETFDSCMEAMRAGNSSDAILAARDRVYGAHGLTAAGSIRYTAHGIGIDSLEPPWAPGKERDLREGMVLSLHPDVALDRDQLAAFGPLSVGDSVRVGARGATRMTYQHEEWVVLDG